MNNPFNKNIEEIEFEDLKTLINNQIKEGFYIEYKSDFQLPKEIAKSIASFANTYGGWYFIGIEDEKTTNIAKDLKGFNINQNKQPLEKIRNIARDYIHPLPYFKTNLIKVKEDNFILVVFIPESFETPHILINGVVYRRNGEESSPIHESDRYTLDKLYQKSINFENRISTFYNDPFGRTCKEFELPYIKLYLIPDIFEDISIENFYNSEYLDDIMSLVNQKELLVEGNKDFRYPLNFQNVTRSTNSIILRDISNGIGFMNYTFEFFDNGVAKIKIPISCSSRSNSLSQNEIGNKYLKKLCDKIGDDLKFYKLVDVCHLLFTIKYAIQKYYRFLNRINYKSKIFVGIELENIYRLIPYIESDIYLNYIEKYHIPICMYKNKEIPDSYSRKSWKEIEFLDFKSSDIQIINIIHMGIGLRNCDEFMDGISQFY